MLFPVRLAKEKSAFRRCKVSDYRGAEALPKGDPRGSKPALEMKPLPKAKHAVLGSPATS
jgi:hypothetical protein